MTFRLRISTGLPVRFGRVARQAVSLALMKRTASETQGQYQS